MTVYTVQVDMDSTGVVKIANTKSVIINLIILLFQGSHMQNYILYCMQVDSTGTFKIAIKRLCHART